jgi:hypothetical protein
MLDLRFTGLRKAVAVLAICGVGSLSAPLMAEEAKPKPAKDPNEKVCEKQSIVGSRLATRRVCATRAEWEEKRRLDKDAIDQGQRSACMLTHNGGTGQPSC